MFETITQPFQEEDILVEELSHTDQEARIIVYNDDVNSFEWVIQCFMEILDHSSEQAEQLSLMIHFKGKAIVKTGEEKTLRPLKDGLCDRGLSAVLVS